MKQTIQSISEETLRLENLFASAQSGEFFTYQKMEELASVKMDLRGKAFMRTALKRLKLPFETISGEGIKLLSKDNASKIVVHKVLKVDNSIKRAAKTTKQVTARVYDDLTEPEQKNLNFLSALFGTIRAYSTDAKRIFQTKRLLAGEKIEQVKP